MKNKIQLALGSRTFWTIAFMFVVNTVHANSGLIPVHALDVINPILGFMATYFHVTPSQNYAA